MLIVINMIHGNGTGVIQIDSRLQIIVKIHVGDSRNATNLWMTVLTNQMNGINQHFTRLGPISPAP